MVHSELLRSVLRDVNPTPEREPVEQQFAYRCVLRRSDRAEMVRVDVVQQGS